MKKRMSFLCPSLSGSVFLGMCIVLAALSACTKETELHHAMEGMGDSFKAMRKAETLEQIKAELDQFVVGVEKASQQKVKAEHQSDFDDGMKQLDDKIAELSVALDTGSISEAQQALKALYEIHEEFHEKLGVEQH